MDSHVILSSVFLVLHQDMELQSNNSFNRHPHRFMMFHTLHYFSNVLYVEIIGLLRRCRRTDDKRMLACYVPCMPV